MAAKPSWRNALLADYDARVDTRAPRSTIRPNFPPDWYELIQDAAIARNLSMSAFIRRASMAFAIYDLGLDWEAVMQEEPRLRGFGEIDSEPVDERGYGRGLWKIEGLGEYRRVDTGE